MNKIDNNTKKLAIAFMISGVTVLSSAGWLLSQSTSQTGNIDKLPETGSCLLSEEFGDEVAWDSEFEATWGDTATWELSSGGIDNTNTLYAPPYQKATLADGKRGSSTRVLHVSGLTSDTDYTLSVNMRIPSDCTSYWVETGYILEQDAPEDHEEVVDGFASAKHFDDDGSDAALHPDGNTAALWTLVKKFSDSGGHENGNNDKWTKYSVSFNSGDSSKISIGLKVGTVGYCGRGHWDTLKLCAGSTAPTPTPGGGNDCVANLQATCNGANAEFSWSDMTAANQYILRVDHDPGNTAQCVNTTSNQDVGWYCPSTGQCKSASCDDKYIQFSTDHSQSTIRRTASVLAGQNYSWYVEALKADGSKCSSTSSQLLTCGSSGGAAVCGPMDTDANGTLDLIDFAKFASVYRKTCSSTTGQNSSCGAQDAAPANGVVDLYDFSKFASKYRQASCAL